MTLMTRRDLLKRIGLTTAAVAFAPSLASALPEPTFDMVWISKEGDTLAKWSITVEEAARLFDVPIRVIADQS